MSPEVSFLLFLFEFLKAVVWPSALVVISNAIAVRVLIICGYATCAVGDVGTAPRSRC